MADNRLRIGTHFTWQGREYVIEGSLPSGELRVKDLLTREYTAKTEAEILNELFFEDLEVVGEDQNLPFLKEKLADSRASDLSILDRDEKGWPGSVRRTGGSITSAKSRAATSPLSRRRALNP